MQCLLAPVPVVHLIGAQARADAAGKVAFGSDKFEFFLGEKSSSLIGLETYIVASKTGFEPSNKEHVKFAIGKVVMQAVFMGVTPADSLGRHPDPGLRTDTVLQTDDPWTVFWEVASLKTLARPMALNRFRSASGKVWSKTPFGPERACYTNQSS